MLTRSPFIRPCSPIVASVPPIGLGWLHEVKFDGYRVQIHKDGKQVALFSKNGNQFTSRYPAVAEAVAKLPTKPSFSMPSSPRATRKDRRTSKRSSVSAPIFCAFGCSTSFFTMAKTYAL